MSATSSSTVSRSTRAISALLRGGDAASEDSTPAGGYPANPLPNAMFRSYSSHTAATNVDVELPAGAAGAALGLAWCGDRSFALFTGSERPSVAGEAKALASSDGGANAGGHISATASLLSQVSQKAGSMSREPAFSPTAAAGIQLMAARPGFLAADLRPLLIQSYTVFSLLQRLMEAVNSGAMLTTLSDLAVRSLATSAKLISCSSAPDTAPGSPNVDALSSSSSSALSSPTLPAADATNIQLLTNIFRSRPAADIPAQDVALRILFQVSSSYRASLEQQCVHLQGLLDEELSRGGPADRMTIGPRATEIGTAVAHLRDVHSIWLLAELLYIGSSSSDMIDIILHWSRFSKALPEERRFLQAPKSLSQESLIILFLSLICRGQIHFAAQVLSHVNSPGAHAFRTLLLACPMPEPGAGNGPIAHLRSRAYNQWLGTLQKCTSQPILADPDLGPVLRMMQGDAHVIFRLTGARWFDLLTSTLCYTPELSLSNHIEVGHLFTALQLSTGGLPLADQIEISLLRMHLTSALRFCSELDPWLSAHLTDLLFHSGSLESELLVQANDVPAGPSSADIRLHFLAPYGTALMEQHNLWRLGVDYLSSCGPPGAAMLEALILRLPLGTDEQVARVVDVCEMLQLTDCVSDVYSVLARRALSTGAPVKALHYYLLTSDPVEGSRRVLSWLCQRLVGTPSPETLALLQGFAEQIEIVLQSQALRSGPVLPDLQLFVHFCHLRQRFEQGDLPGAVHTLRSIFMRPAELSVFSPSTHIWPLVFETALPLIRDSPDLVAHELASKMLAQLDQLATIVQFMARQPPTGPAAGAPHGARRGPAPPVDGAALDRLQPVRVALVLVLGSCFFDISKH
ncbi:hypothetical protein H696_01649 [Fonticula alba]|uniref:Nuclear pore complex protein Nup85 n=1 Tax=Fonticula alba TaxID=691883 RepID=A0A058ZCW2_FONAL|nr:hypothetical protein H696_01649 [Fonticula alba]KCV72250.1 hypothetical protein H696_01649 [Fonticula alba]|eukprot:XP_009493828.1 hypothetical protein H696_01649 [Fonticula alba]